MFIYNYDGVPTLYYITLYVINSIIPTIINNDQQYNKSSKGIIFFAYKLLLIIGNGIYQIEGKLPSRWYYNSIVHEAMIECGTNEILNIFHSNTRFNCFS